MPAATRPAAPRAVLDRRLGAAVCLLLVCATAALAHDLTPSMGRPATERHLFQGNQFARAGNPQCLSHFARPTDSPHETGYFIGGGARTRAAAGQPRSITDGTWGTDYTGILFPKHIELNWWHGQRAQGGGLGYRNVAPRVLHRP
jgi:hypothetical protein